MSDRILRALDVFDRVVDLGPDERTALLDDECAGDEDLRVEVLRMLSVEGSTGFLDVAEASATKLASLEESSGSKVGPFTIRRTLGSGGMGIVYEADQEVPRRRVALKMLPSSFGRSGAERRFHAEVQLLARLDHPAIARVLEAGVHVSEQGTEQPYFAMEYVEDAQDLVAWGKARSLRERITLFTEVCDAIQHGHQQGVVHRDLKPANVLVSSANDPKVIDFGVARAIDGAGDSPLQATRTGEIVGTLSYMAPEQLDGSAHVDTRTDVYALGLLLYELIAGEAPFDLTGCTLTEVAQIIRDSPPRPIHRLKTTVPEDLGWIVMRAIEKEPERRYPSASELSSDLRRFLTDVPVEARRPSRAYALGKFVRRNRVATISGALVLLAILIGTGVAVVAMLRANDEAEKFRVINGVLTGMFAGVRVEEGGAEIRAVELLERASALVPSFDDRPALQAELRVTLAVSYGSLALDQQRVREAEGALALAHELSPELEHRAALHLAAGLKGLDRVDEASEVVERYTAPSKLRDVPDQQRIRMRLLAANLRLRSGEAKPAARDLEVLLAEAQSALGFDAKATVDVEEALAHAWIAVGRYADVESMTRQRIEANRGAANHADLRARCLLGRALARQDRDAEAQELFEEVLPAARDAFGPEHLRTLVVMNDLAGAYLNNARPADAAPIYEELVRAWESREGPDHPETLVVKHGHARALAEIGDASAEEVFRATLDARERLYGSDDARTLHTKFELGRFLRQSGRLDEADSVLSDVVERGRAAFTDADVARHRDLAELGMLRLYQKRPLEAVDLLRKAWEGYKRRAGALDVDTLLTGVNLGSALLESQRWGEATDVYLEVLDSMRAGLEPSDPRICTTMTNLAMTYAQRGESKLAQAQLNDALDWTSAHLPQEHPRRLKLLEIAGSYLVSLERPEEALGHYEELARSVRLHPKLDAVARSTYRLGHARCLAACGRDAAAADEFETVLEMERARVGDRDPAWIASLEAELNAVRKELSDPTHSR